MHNSVGFTAIFFIGKDRLTHFVGPREGFFLSDNRSDIVHLTVGPSCTTTFGNSDQGVTRSCKLMDRQYNAQKKKDTIFFKTLHRYSSVFLFTHSYAFCMIASKSCNKYSRCFNRCNKLCLSISPGWLNRLIRLSQRFILLCLTIVIMLSF